MIKHNVSLESVYCEHVDACAVVSPPPPKHNYTLPPTTLCMNDFLKHICALYDNILTNVFTVSLPIHKLWHLVLVSQERFIVEFEGIKY